VKASDVESFNLPLYLPSIEEVKSIIEKEGSFEVVQHCVSVDLYGDAVDAISDDAEEKLRKFGKFCRAALEPLLVSHFGDSIIDPLISTTLKVFAKHFYEDQEYKLVWIAISLQRREVKALRPIY
jgi:SAM dependent carboxyl methyltransferase